MYCIKVFLGFHDFLQNFLLLEKGGAQFNIHSQKYYLFPLTVFHLNAAAAAKSLQLCPTLRDPMDCSPPGSSIHQIRSDKSVTQSCPTLCDPMDCSLPGSSVHGIFQARVLEWAAIAFSIYIHMCTYIHTFFTHSFIDGHLGFHILAIVNKASVSMEMHLSFQISF